MPWSNELGSQRQTSERRCLVEARILPLVHYTFEQDHLLVLRASGHVILVILDE